MEYKKIFRTYISIPFIYSLISSITLAVFMYPDVPADERYEVFPIVLLHLSVLLILISIAGIILYHPVQRFLKKGINEKAFKKRVNSLQYFYGGIIFFISIMWNLGVIYPNAMEGDGFHLIAYLNMGILFLLSLVFFPTFLAFTMIGSVTTKIMKYAYNTHKIEFNPGRNSIWPKFVFLILTISIIPAGFLIVDNIFNELIRLGITEPREESTQVRIFYIIILTISILTSIFVSVFTFIRQLKASIGALLSVFRKVESGNLDADIPVTSYDEVGQLTFNYNKMLKGLQEREKLKTQFGNYVSSEIAEYVMNNDAALEGEERTVTVLFTDIAGYTTLSEKLSPKQTVATLNSYYNMLVEIVQNHKGVVNKFIGDSLMAIFNAPLKDADHAKNAINCAREIITITENTYFNKDIKLITRVGINTGPVIAGNLGSKERHEYTVIGDAVNLAQRLEQLGKKYDKRILYSENTLSFLDDDIKGDYVGKVQVKGKSIATKVYSI